MAGRGQRAPLRHWLLHHRHRLQRRDDDVQVRRRAQQPSSTPHALHTCTPPLCSGKLLKEKLDVVRLTFYTAPVSLACLAPFFVVYVVRVWCWRGGGA